MEKQCLEDVGVATVDEYNVVHGQMYCVIFKDPADRNGRQVRSWNTLGDPFL